jgi:hypothetical protein
MQPFLIFRNIWVWRVHMILIHTSDGMDLKVLDAVVKGCWINVVDPNTDEIEQQTDLGIPQDWNTNPLDIEESLRVNEKMMEACFSFFGSPISRE